MLKEGSAEGIDRKSISAQIIEMIRAVNFGDGIEMVPVDNEETFDLIKNSKLGLDYRSKKEGDEESASVFDGLDFDPDKLRSQAFALFDMAGAEKIPVGIMTFTIAPRRWVEKERYWEKVSDGVVVRDHFDLSDVVGSERSMPEFIISPSWTKVDPRYAGKFAIPGFNVIRKTLGLLAEAAPDQTFLEVSAQGQAGQNDRTIRQRLAGIVSSSSAGQKFTNQEIEQASGINGFMNLIGKSTEGSATTVQVAKLLGINEAVNYGDDLTLGPVFSKRIK
ncbi:MAG: hypothetical protein WCV92_00495 [Candidatus Buchananbacteria bacterium]